MLSTLVLAVALSVPAPITPVNFVHDYKPNDKLTYVVTMGTPVLDFEASMTIGAKKDGKSQAKIEVTEMDLGGVGETGDKSVLNIVLDRFGIPVLDKAASEDMLTLIALMTTYLPNKTLDIGTKFDFKRSNYEFDLVSKGSFIGMESIGKVNYAVLESVAEITPKSDVVATMSVKTFYNPDTKRVDKTTADIDTPDGLYKLTLSLKK